MTPARAATKPEIMNPVNTRSTHRDARVPGGFPVAAHREELPARLRTRETKTLHGDEHQDEDQHAGRELARQAAWPKASPASLFASTDRGLVGQDECHVRAAQNSVPSVAMKELMPITATKKALTAPTTSPAASAATIPSARSGKLAITTPGDRQGAGHAQVQFAHQDHGGQTQSDDADQGDAAQCDLVGGQGERLEKRDHDDDEGQQHDAASLCASRRSSTNATPRARRLVGAQRNSATHRWATLRARASKETASTISTPSATCWYPKLMPERTKMFVSTLTKITPRNVR